MYLEGCVRGEVCIHESSGKVSMGLTGACVRAYVRTCVRAYVRACVRACVRAIRMRFVSCQ